jgi:DNA-binding beta-propeller fold protein YncE
MTRARRLTPTVLATLGVLAGGLLSSSAPALAFKGYALVGQFGTAGSGNGELSSPAGVAVSQATKDVYVVDGGNNRVEQFSSTGTYLSQFNGTGAPTGVFSAPEAIAVDNSTNPLDTSAGDVYVADTGHGVIDKFSSAGTYISQLKETSGGSVFGELRGVAVDPEGNVWVYEGEGHVDEFSDTGSFVKTFNTGRGAQLGLAVDSSDSVYAICCGEEVGKFDSTTGIQLAEFSGGGTTALAIDSSTNKLFVDKASSIEEFGPFGEPFSSPVATFPAEGLLSASHGIAVVDTAGVGKVYATEREAGKVVIFNEVLVPDVSTGGSSNIKRTTATIEGSLNPDKTKAKYYFQYGESKVYGSTTAVTGAGEGEVEVPASANLTSLHAGTIYHYRLVAENENGANYGSDGTFETSPAVEGVHTEAAGGVGPTSATLNGSLEPNGFDTHYFFEYGESESYGSTTTREDAGELSEVKQVNPAPVSGLEPNKTYHFRLAAENSFGTTHGSDETLTTVKAPPVIHPSAVVTRTTAALTGTVNPENSPTSYHFVYGPTASYGQSSPVIEAGSSFGEEIIDAGVISELEPGTTLHYRLIATNEAGTIESSDQTLTTNFPTPPTVATAGASGVSQNSATLSGTVGTNGLQTNYGFEIGTEAGNYGPATGLGSLGGATTQTVTLTLGELQPGTTYHYRVLATNSDGASYGAEETFTTPGFPVLLTAPAAPPLIGTPAFAFPTGSQANTGKTEPKKLTRAQKLTKALKACHKKKGAKRASCEKSAHKKYGSTTKKAKGKTK